MKAMTAVLERRGPEGTHHWISGRVALGHTLLATTPEARMEVLPLGDPESGCTITADVRLDNRAELAADLGIGQGGAAMGDGELILRAYLRWDVACLEHLLGDFAFAIWDPRCDRLFCARDHMGMRQINYSHVEGERFVFATEAPAIAALRGRAEPLNEARIADFLTGLEALDFSSTFYRNIHRLPPAHYLLFENGALRLVRYWQLTPKPLLDLPSDEAYAEAFLEVFTEAVRCRLRSDGPVGSMLSGGVDSGSVVAVATSLLAQQGRGPLYTFSAISPGGEDCVETRSIEAALAMPGLVPTQINCGELGPYQDDLMRLTQAADEPFDGHMMLPRAVYLAAQRKGIKVMLDGAGGDLALAAATQIPRLLRTGRWMEAWRDLKGERAIYAPGYSLWRNLAWACRMAWTPGWLKRLKRLVERALRRDRVYDELIEPEFAEHIGAVERRRAYEEWFPTKRVSLQDERAHGLTRPDLVVGRERYDRTAAALAIEPRDPFLDLRVVELCLRIPGDQLLREGWSKALLRRSVKGLLPDAVRWRRGKQHLGWSFTQAVLSQERGWLDPIAENHPILARYIKAAVLERVGQLDDSVVDGERVSCFYLANWLGLLQVRNERSD